MNDDENPFAPPSAGHKRKYAPSKDPSVEQEPHLIGEEYLPHEGADLVSDVAAAPNEANVTDSVWDEPALSPDLAGNLPDDAVSWARWLDRNIARTSVRKSWFLSFAGGVVSGGIAIGIALLSGMQTTMPLIMLFHCVFAVAIKETLKVGVAILIVEFRPHLFKTSGQILLATGLGGFTFAVVEKLATLSAPQPWLVGWAWSTYLPLQVGTSLGVGVGLAQVWQQCMKEKRQPQISVAAPWLGIAIAIHTLFSYLGP